MTGKSVPTAVGFAIITASQLVIGVFLIRFAVQDGGEAELFSYQKRHAHPGRPLFEFAT